MDYKESFLSEAFALAKHSVQSNMGGPFGAIIVLDGIIIGRGVNQVTSKHDPTAHAEIMAIRDACANLKTHNLDGAVLYSTCEPCPMCFSAIYWANLRAVYYASTRHDAAAIGFKDNHIYEEIGLRPDQRSIVFHRVTHPLAPELFNQWTLKTDKIPY